MAPPMRWLRFLLIAAVLAAAMLASWPLARRYVPVALVGFWRSQILQATDDDLPRLLAELGNLEDAALPALAELIGSQRAAVSRAARVQLSRQVNAWFLLPPGEAADHLGAVAAALAAHAVEYGPSARDYAEDIVDRLIEAGRSNRGLLPASAWSDCEIVLQVATAAHRLKFALRDPASAEAEQYLPPVHDEPAPAAAAESASEGPGEQAAAAEKAPRAAAAANAAEPMRIETPAAPASSAPAPLDLESDPLRELPEMPPRRTPLEFKPTRLELPAGSRQGSSAKGSLAAAEEEARIFTWMHQLHSADATIVQHAASHLAEAGFAPAHLELARSLTSPNPAEREQLAEILPQVPGIDAKTWLIWLSRDERAEVRLAAISVMATINDPVLLKRVRDMAAADPDPRLRAQLQRLSARRGGGLQ